MGKRASLITLLPVLAVSDDEGFAVFPFPVKIKNKLFLRKKNKRCHDISYNHNRFKDTCHTFRSVTKFGEISPLW